MCAFARSPSEKWTASCQQTISATQPAHAKDTGGLKFNFQVQFSIPIEEIDEMFIMLFNFAKIIVLLRASKVGV